MLYCRILSTKLSSEKQWNRNCVSVRRHRRASLTCNQSPFISHKIRGSILLHGNFGWGSGSHPRRPQFNGIFTFTIEMTGLWYLVNFFIVSVVRVVTLVGFDFSSRQFFFCFYVWLNSCFGAFRCSYTLSSVQSSNSSSSSLGKLSPAPLIDVRFHCETHSRSQEIHYLSQRSRSLCWEFPDNCMGTWKDWRRHLTAWLSLWRKTKRNDKWRSFIPSFVLLNKLCRSTPFYGSAKIAE